MKIQDCPLYRIKAGALLYQHKDPTIIRGVSYISYGIDRDSTTINSKETIKDIDILSLHIRIPTNIAKLRDKVDGFIHTTANNKREVILFNHTVVEYATAIAEPFFDCSLGCAGNRFYELINDGSEMIVVTPV